MKQRTDIEKRIEETLNSLDGIQRAVPRPYFYTRLKARIDKAYNGWNGIAGFIGRPVYALAMICIVLFVNAWIVFKTENDEKSINNNQQTITDLPDEYNLTVTTLYNYETP